MTANNAARTARSKRTVGVALSAAVLALLTACSPQAAEPGGQEKPGGGGEASNETTTVRVATSVSNSFPFIVVQAGERLGTWEGTGLNVEVVEATTPTIGQVMAGNQADIALAGANSEAANIQSGVEMTIVASNLTYWDQRIIAGPDVESVEDLKGGNFGITGAGSPGEYSVVKMAESLGWAESDYTVTSLGNLPALVAALTAGQIDAFAWSSQAAFQLEQAGDGKIVAPGAEYVGPNVLQSFAVMDAFAEANPTTVQTFFEAYFAMVEKIQADPQLFIDVLVEEWEVDPEVAARVAEESLPELSTDGVISADELQGIRETAAFTVGMPVDEFPEVKYTLWEDLN
jgi:ABC-type nitrate/sulfonate/bicarbonate transport system substrate-binding protein